MSGFDDKHPPEVADFDLVVAAQKGDGRAYDCLVRRYQRQVYRWAFHVVRMHDLADEVTQDVFVRTYEALARIDPNRPFGAWLCRTTVNIALNLLRKNQFRAQQLLHNRPDPSDYEREAAQPEASFRRRRLLARLEAEIDRLPEVYRTIILLRLRDALTYEEIREALGVSMGTVMSRLARARRKLREALGNLLEDLRE